MALTSAQKANIVFYLGWPSKALVSGSTHYNTTIVTRLTDLDSDTETIVTALLTDIATARTKMAASQGRMLVKKVGDIELNTDENTLLVRDYRRLVNDLSVLLDIPVLRSGGVNVSVVV